MNGIQAQISAETKERCKILEQNNRAQNRVQEALRKHAEAGDLRVYENQQAIKQLREFVHSKITEKYKSCDNTVGVIREQCESKIREIETRTHDLTCGLEGRVSDCETIQRTRVTEDFVKTFGRQLSVYMENLLARRAEVIDEKIAGLKADTELLQKKANAQVKENFSQCEQTTEELRKLIDGKLSKKELIKINAMIDATREHGDRRLAEVRTYTNTVEDKLEMVQRLVQRLQMDIKKGEAALARVPPDVASQIETLTLQFQKDHTEVRAMR